MQKKRFVSLNIKVFLLALAVMIIPTIVVGATLYNKSIEIVKQKQEILVKNALRNITDNMDVNMTNAHSVSLFVIADGRIRNALLASDMSQSEILVKQNEILSSLSFFTGQTSYIESIYIHGENGLDVYSGKTDVKINDEDAKEAVFQKGGPVWKWKQNPNEKTVNLSLIREIKNKENPQEKLGIMRIDISSTMLEEQFKNFVEAYPGQISLWDENGKEVYAYGNSPLMENVLAQGIQKMQQEYTWIEAVNEKDNVLSYYYRIPDSSWILTSSMQFTALYAENSVIRDLLVTGIGASLILCTVIVFIFTRAILLPLKQLTGKIREISEENYKIRLDYDSNDEIGILSRSFNNMARRLDEVVNEVLRGKVLQRDAQLKALQAQINPHFLYNNLDTAYWMSRLEKAEKTGKILLALSALYRSTVSTTGKLISVDMEIRYVKDYIVIQQMRLNTMVEFLLEVEEDTLNDTTLRFVIQPLVENSIQHGILPAKQPGIIKIRIYHSEGILYFEVEDTGRGISIEELTALLAETDSEEKRGMAIRNIHQRISLQFGPEYGLHFEEIASGGIRAVVKQPIISYEIATAD